MHVGVIVCVSMGVCIQLFVCNNILKCICLCVVGYVFICKERGRLNVKL